MAASLAAMAAGPRGDGDAGADAQASLTFARAVLKYQAADFDGALKLLLEGVRASPGHLPSKHRLGVLAMQRGQHQEGEQHLRDVLKDVLGTGNFRQSFFELGRRPRRGVREIRARRPLGCYVQELERQP